MRCVRIEKDARLPIFDAKLGIGDWGLKSLEVVRGQGGKKRRGGGEEGNEMR